MKKIFITTALLLSGSFLFAQKGPMKATSLTKAAYVHEIPALSKMDNIIAAKGFEHVAPPKRRGQNTIVPGKGYPKGMDPLVTTQRQVSTETTNRAPLTSFVAHKGTVLNDPTGAIGPNHYVYAFNSGFGIRDRAGNVLLPEASLGTIFPNETLGDPIVVYDRYADRFIIMEFSNTPNGVLIAVCKGPDPVNDGWYTYRFNTGSFPDYEKLSVWQDGYYITANKDQGSTTTSEVVYAVERDKMLTGDPNAQMVGFPLPGSVNSGFYSPGGFSCVGPNLPPAGTPHPIVYLQDDAWNGVSNDHLKIWNISVDWNTPSNSSISQPQSITTSAFDSVFDNGSFNNLDEPGRKGADIDALQATMMYMTNYRRFGSHNSAVMNFVVDLDGRDELAGIRWYELRQANDGAPWTIHQEGTYTQPDGHSAFSGSINIDAAGNIGLGYTIVSSTVYTSLRYTGRLASDPLGTMTMGEQFIVDGDTNNNRRDGRYGDYSQLTIDPTDDMTFWHIGEYMQGASTEVRKSHVAAFKVTEGGGNNGSGCDNGIASFPYSESFENTLGDWTQSSDDNTDWAIQSNGTPTNGTGPSAAADGTYYLYVEANGSRNKKAYLDSPCYDLSNESQASVSFNYHMYGSGSMGSLSLEASSDNGSTWTSIWSLSGNQGNAWQSANVDLAAYTGGNLKLRFNRQLATSNKADMAIDAVAISTTSKQMLTTFALADDTSKSFKVFPVPATRSLEINTNGTPINEVQIFSAFGLRVKSNNHLNQNKVDISNLAPGTYFIRINTDDKTVTRKFIKR